MRLVSLMMVLSLACGITSYAQVNTFEAFDIVDAANKIAEKTKLSIGKDASIRVENFTFKGVSDRGLGTAVIKELGIAKIPVALPGQDSDFSIRGEIQQLLGRGGIGFSIICEIKKAGQTESTFTAEVTSLRTTHETVTPTGETIAPPDPRLTPSFEAKPGQEADTIATAIVTPTIKEVTEPKKDGTTATVMKLLPSPRSPYSVSFFGKQPGEKEYSPIPIEFGKDGQPRIKVQMDQLIAVGVRNQSDFEAGVRLFVDGINRFATATNQRESNIFDVVPANDFRRIAGWYKHMKPDGNGGLIQKVNAFQIGKFEDAVAAQLGGPAEVGMFQVTIGVATDPNVKVKIPHEVNFRDAPPAGIKQGPPINEAVKVLNRKLGTTRAVFRVIYDVTPKQ